MPTICGDVARTSPSSLTTCMITFPEASVAKIGSNRPVWATTVRLRACVSAARCASRTMPAAVSCSVVVPTTARARGDNEHRTEGNFGAHRPEPVGHLLLTTGEAISRTSHGFQNSVWEGSIHFSPKRAHVDFNSVQVRWGCLVP